MYVSVNGVPFTKEALKKGRWHQVVIMVGCSAGGVRVYVDGKEAGKRVDIPPGVGADQPWALPKEGLLLFASHVCREPLPLPLPLPGLSSVFS